MMKISIDREACIGASACVAAAGKTFALDTEGKAIPLCPAGDDSEKILAAAVACPTGAIVLENEDATSRA